MTYDNQQTISKADLLIELKAAQSTKYDRCKEYHWLKSHFFVHILQGYNIFNDKEELVSYACKAGNGDFVKWLEREVGASKLLNKILIKAINHLPDTLEQISIRALNVAIEVFLKTYLIDISGIRYTTMADIIIGVQSKDLVLDANYIRQFILQNAEWQYSEAIDERGLELPGGIIEEIKKIYNNKRLNAIDDRLAENTALLEVNGDSQKNIETTNSNPQNTSHVNDDSQYNADAINSHLKNIE